MSTNNTGVLEIFLSSNSRTTTTTSVKTMLDKMIADCMYRLDFRREDLNCPIFDASVDWSLRYMALKAIWKMFTWKVAFNMNGATSWYHHMILRDRIHKYALFAFFSIAKFYDRLCDVFQNKYNSLSISHLIDYMKI